jgi:Mce-associated membrane protein
MNTPDPTGPATDPTDPEDTADAATSTEAPADATASDDAGDAESRSATADTTAAPSTESPAPTPSSSDDTSSSRAVGIRRFASTAALPVASVVVVAGLVAAIVFAGIYGYRWYDDAENKVPVQTARDDALGGAEQAMLNILNIDLKNSDAYQKRLQASVTGSAQQQLLGSSGLGELQKQAGDPANAATLTAKLQRSAVVSLDDDRNNATTLVFLNVTSSRPNQASSSQTMGFQVGVTKNDGVWKANTIQPLDSVAIDSTDAGQAGGAAPSAAPSSAAPAPGGN